MALKLEAEVDLAVVLGQLDGRLERMTKMLERPSLGFKLLPASAVVAAGRTKPVLLDFGAVPDGSIWDVDLISLFIGDPFTNPASSNSAIAFGQATGPAGNALFVGPTPAAGVYSVSVWIGFGAGAPAAADAVNWQLNTQNAGYGANAGVLWVPPVANGQLVRYDFPSVPADGTHQIAITNPGAATAGVVYVAEVEATPVAGSGGLTAALFVGVPPQAPGQVNPADLVVTGLPVPGSATYGSRRPMVDKHKHLYALVSGPGLANLAGNLFGTAWVSIVPDDQKGEAISWL
jgi:hypothetical protein